jgi:hypothetical protein
LTESSRALFGLQMAWEQLSFILGVSGNAFVLYATIAHNAIKLDKMSVWVIKNLAVADIANCVLVLLPVLLIQYGKLSGVLIFGHENTFYYILLSYMYFFSSANIILINILSLNKLIRCIYPLRHLQTSRCQRIKVTGLTVFMSAIPTMWTIYGILDGFMSLREQVKQYQYLGARHILELHFTANEEWKIILGALIVFGFLLMASITMVILNSALVIFAVKRSKSAVNKKNILTVIIITVVFLISFVPSLVILWTEAEDGEIELSFIWLSSWTNPFIYLAVNPSFREFTKNFIRRTPSNNPPSFRRNVPFTVRVTAENVIETSI